MMFRLKWTARLIMCLFPDIPLLLKALGDCGNLYFLDMVTGYVALKDKPSATWLVWFDGQPLTFQNRRSKGCHWTDHLMRGSEQKQNSMYLFSPDSKAPAQPWRGAQTSGCFISVSFLVWTEHAVLIKEKSLGCRTRGAINPPGS